MNSLYIPQFSFISFSYILCKYLKNVKKYESNGEKDVSVKSKFYSSYLVGIIDFQFLSQEI